MYVDNDVEHQIRIDNFLTNRATRALTAYDIVEESPLMFAGIARGTFDGVLKEVDLRGTVARAKLVLNLGGMEIDCTCNSVTVENLADALDKRVSVDALAYYNGEDRLPERIDIKRITIFEQAKAIFEQAKDFRRWRGAFNIPYPYAEGGLP